MKARGINRLLTSFIIVSFIILAAAVPARADTNTQINEKVSEIVDNLIYPGMSERDKALALHDWLTENSYYDLSFTWFSPEGVLLHGTGVCESYARAYRLLLDKAGFENTLITGTAKNSNGTQESHAWNLVKVNGKWKHVDVTWDDPIDLAAKNKKLPLSGHENTIYFLVGNRFILGDHTPDTASAAKIKELVSDDEDEDSLPSPVNVSKRIPAPDFRLINTAGKTLTRDGFGTGKKMILVYGNSGCLNTQAFLRYISPYIDPMKKRNITVAVVLMDDSTIAEKKAFEAAFPGIVCTTPAEDDSSIWNGLEAMGYDDSSVIFPIVFLKNAQNKLTYYSTGFVDEPLRIVAGALAMEDDPEEDKTEDNANDIVKDTPGNTDDKKDSSKDDSGKTVDPTKNTDPEKTVAPGKTVDPGKTTAKAKQPMTVKAKTVKIKYSKLKKKAQTVKIRKALTVKKAKGKVTYKKKKGNKKITVNKKSGKIKIKKGLKKGTYPVKIKVTAAGTKNYKKGSRTVSVKIKVK